MNLDVLTLYQASLAVFTVAFHLEYSGHDLIKFKSYNNWSAQATNNTSKSAVLNSSKQTKFSHLQKLANQSMLNGTHVIEITITCIVDSMKVKHSLIFHIQGNVSIRKNTRWWKYIF